MTTTTHVIRSGDEAVEVARSLATTFALDAAERDRERRLPGKELDELSASGLLGITVPTRFGGARVPMTALAEVFALLGAADASLAQIPQSHFVFLEALRLAGSDEQQARYFAAALTGARFANAQSERNTKTIAEDATTLTPEGAGYRLDGEKFYSTGALFAHWLVVRAVLSTGETSNAAARSELADGTKALAYIPSDAPGVTIVDDWNGMGQRTTASGTVRLDGVAVEKSQVVPFTTIFDRPTVYGARAQILHAAIDAGLARGAIGAAVTQVAKARPWFEAGVEKAGEEPLLVQQAGELEITVRGAEALLREAAAAIDAAESDLTDAGAANASLATAVAKVAAARASVEASSLLFELSGTRSAAEPLNLSRFWRDARTHTLHDPVRWKVQHVGRWVLNGTPPPRHGTI